MKPTSQPCPGDPPADPGPELRAHPDGPQVPDPDPIVPDVA